MDDELYSGNDGSPVSEEQAAESERRRIAAEALGDRWWEVGA